MAKPKIGLLIGTRGIVMSSQRDNTVPVPDLMIRLAEEAENSGLDSIWVGDSLVSKPRFEPITALSYLAARTSSVKLGTSVLLPALRNPVTLAHSLATLDILSRGRVVIGAGVGGAFNADQKKDWTSVDVDPSKRAKRFTETVEILKRLWTEDHVSYSGSHFSLQDVTLDPKPARNDGIPVLLATHNKTGSDAQILRAALHGDGIIGITDSPEEFQTVCAKVDQAVLAQKKTLDTFQHVYYMTVNLCDDVAFGEAEARDFLMSYYNVNHWGNSWGPWGKAQDIVSRIKEYSDAGADTVIIRFASWNQNEQWDRFAKQVLPEFKD